MKILKITLSVFLLIGVAAAGLMARGEAEGSSAGEGISTIEWYLPAGGNFPYDPDLEAEVYEAFNKIAREEIGVEVNFNVLGNFGDFTKKMPVIMAAGEYFDVCFTSSWCNPFYKGVNGGYYAELNDLLPMYAPKLWEEQKDILPSTTVEGNIYAVWNPQTAVSCAQAIVLKNVADAVGLDQSKVNTWEELTPYLEKIKNQFPDLVPVSSSVNWYMYAYDKGYMVDAYAPRIPISVGIKDPDCKLVWEYNIPEMKDLYKLNYEWHTKGFFDPDPAIYFNNQMRTNAEVEGRYAVTMNNNWTPGQTERHGRECTFIKIGPAIKSDKSIIITLQALSAESKYKEESVQLLELVNNNSAAFNTISYGLEGKTYVKKGANRVEKIENTGYWPNIPWAMGNRMIGFIIGNQPDDYYIRTKEANDNAMVANIMGFVPDTEPVKTELANVEAIRKASDLEGIFFDNSDITFDEWMEMVDAQNQLEWEAGLDKILKVGQAQVDAWLESNK